MCLTLPIVSYVSHEWPIALDVYVCVIAQRDYCIVCRGVCVRCVWIVYPCGLVCVAVCVVVCAVGYHLCGVLHCEH